MNGRAYPIPHASIYLWNLAPFVHGICPLIYGIWQHLFMVVGTIFMGFDNYIYGIWYLHLGVCCHGLGAGRHPSPATRRTTKVSCLQNSGGLRDQSHLTECIHQLVLESRLPHKIVYLLFTITNQNIKLTISWES